MTACLFLILIICNKMYVVHASLWVRYMATRHCQITLLHNSIQSEHLKLVVIVDAPLTRLARNHYYVFVLEMQNLGGHCFFFFLFRRITSEAPEVEPCRMGLAQDKATLSRCHLKFKSAARRKSCGLKACRCTTVFPKMPFHI